MSRCVLRSLVAFSSLACGLTWTAIASAADPAPAAPKTDPPAAEKTVDLYAVPDGDTDKMLAYIDSLQKFRPRTREEYFNHIEKMPAAITKAAERILELEKDKNSEAAKTAKTLLLSMRVRSLYTATPDEQKKVLAEVLKIMDAKGADLGIEEARLGDGAARAIEASGNSELAVEAYTKIGAAFAKSKDKRLADAAGAFDGVIRRLKLPGNTMEINGKMLDGNPFDWSKYRGKVVLVDFWATWCGPCIAELPNVKANYDLYHDKGFDVVGISLDTDRQKLVDFLAKEKTPWVQLFEDGAGWQHPVAKYYGIQGIPTVILVDKEGKVVSLRARGEELGKLLAKLLGPADQKTSDKKDKPVASTDGGK